MKGRHSFGNYGELPPPASERIGWRVIFSEDTGHVDRMRAHFLIGATHKGLAYRLCRPGYLVNPELAREQGEFRQCLICAELLLKERPQ